MSKQSPSVPRPPPPDTDAAPSETAFDIWLDRGLHRLFDDIAREPIPDALLKIIEADRSDQGE